IPAAGIRASRFIPRCKRSRCTQEWICSSTATNGNWNTISSFRPGRTPIKLPSRSRVRSESNSTRRGISCCTPRKMRSPSTSLLFTRPLVGNDGRSTAGFVLKGPREVGFTIAAYDRRQPLVIDPTITYATFLGGAGQDDGGGMSLDTSTPGAPKMYVAGTTTDDTTFPETGSNVVFLTKTGASNYIFIAKIDPTLTGAA